jgi:ElaB/YqjD/DUF883 family membrane-anchored ribosome-binding protein
VTDLGDTAARKIDENRIRVASGLESAARAIHTSGETASAVADSAANRASATADYVRQHDVNTMLKDVERLVKNNPGPSLLAAAAFGFLVGCTFTRSD